MFNVDSEFPRKSAFRRHCAAGAPGKRLAGANVIGNNMMGSKNCPARYADCVHFRNDAAYLERHFRGLNSLSSAHGSGRGDDGICLRHDRYLSARACCSKFRSRNRL